MKYTVSVDINKPLDRVIELFDNPANMPKWMEGLESFEHILGTPGQPGAQMQLVYLMGKRRIEMIETVISRNLPEEFTGSYEAPGVYNIVKNKFEAIDESSTRYTTEQEFQFKSFMMKVMGFFMPGAFKKQSLKYLNSFKAFVEKEG